MYRPEIAEGEARGRLRRLYYTIKATMRVPLVSEPLRVLALYPHFLHLAWEASRPNLLSVHFERHTSELGSFAPPTLSPSSLSTVLHHDLRGARRVLPMFRYAQLKLLLLLTAWQEELSERPITGLALEDAFWPPAILSHFPRQPPLLRIDHVPVPLRSLLVQITDTHGWFSPPDVYRTLAAYPTFLTSAWTLLQPIIHTAPYAQASRQLLHHAKQLVHTLPHPLPLSPQRLLLQISEREVAAGLGIIAAYHQALPRMVLDVELMLQLLQSKS